MRDTFICGSFFVPMETAFRIYFQEWKKLPRPRRGMLKVTPATAGVAGAGSPPMHVTRCSCRHLLQCLFGCPFQGRRMGGLVPGPA